MSHVFVFISSSVKRAVAVFSFMEVTTNTNRKLKELKNLDSFFAMGNIPLLVVNRYINNDSMKKFSTACHK